MAYKRRIILINPKFQLKFSFFISLLILGVSIIYPFTLYHVLEGIISVSDLNAGILEEKRNTLMNSLIAFQLGYMLVIFMLCIYFSHRIAGPLFKLNQYLKRISRNEEVETIKCNKYSKNLAFLK